MQRNNSNPSKFFCITCQIYVKLDLDFYEILKSMLKFDYTINLLVTDFDIKESQNNGVKWYLVHTRVTNSHTRENKQLTMAQNGTSVGDFGAWYS